MTSAPHLLFLAASTRPGSWNARLARTACTLADGRGARAEWVDLADYRMPLYEATIEERDGLPERARALKQKFRGADGFLVASPEYNSAYPALLKNTIDWLSRRETSDEPGLSAFRGKVAATVAASPGANGGLRGLAPLRLLLGNIGLHVVPPQLALKNAGDAFQEDGSLRDPANQAALEGVVDSLIGLAGALRTQGGSV